MKDIRGMLFFRDSGEQHPEVPGANIYMVIGLVAIPEGANIKDEHQAVVAGSVRDDNESLHLIALTGDKMIDPPLETKGWGIGALLTEAIWRI